MKILTPIERWFGKTDSAEVVAEKARRELLSPLENASLDTERERISKAAALLDAKVAARDAIVREWNDKTAALESLGERLANVQSLCDAFPNTIAEIEERFLSTVGSLGTDANPPAHLAREALIGKLMIPFYRQALERLRAQHLAATETLRAFGKTNSVPQKLRPDPITK